MSYLLKFNNTDYYALSNVDFVYHMQRFGRCLYGGLHVCFYYSDICFRY